MAVADLDPLLLSLLEVSGCGAWERWLGELGAAFGSESVTLAPFSPGSPAGWRTLGAGRDALAFPEFAAWLAAVKAAGPLPLRLPAGTDDSAFGLGANLDVGTERSALLLRRAGGGSPFSSQEIQSFQRVAAYVERVLRRQRASATGEADVSAFRQVLNRSRRGFLLLDGTFAIVFANTAAISALNSGGAIGLRGRRPTPRNRADARRLTEAMESAVATPGGQSVVTLRGADDEVELVANVGGLVRPSPELDLGAPQAAIMMRLSSAVPKRTRFAEGYLESIFHLTRKEAQVASLLVAGLELPDVATELTITYGTTRQHLKAIFAKTGLHRQRDLVHLLRMSLPPDSEAAGAAEASLP